MRPNDLPFAGWHGFVHRYREVDRQFNFLLRAFTPRTVFLEIGPPDCELCLRAASYVDRVWCVNPGDGMSRPPCNLRLLRGAAIAAVPAGSVDVAFSAGLKDLEAIQRLLAPGGVYFIAAQRALPRGLFRDAGFSRVASYVGGLKVPAALAKLARSAHLAAYK